MERPTACILQSSELRGPLLASHPPGACPQPRPSRPAPPAATACAGRATWLAAPPWLSSSRASSSPAAEVRGSHWGGWGPGDGPGDGPGEWRRSPSGTRSCFAPTAPPNRHPSPFNPPYRSTIPRSANRRANRRVHPAVDPQLKRDRGHLQGGGLLLVFVCGRLIWPLGRPRAGVVGTTCKAGPALGIGVVVPNCARSPLASTLHQLFPARAVAPRRRWAPPGRAW